MAGTMAAAGTTGMAGTMAAAGTTGMAGRGGTTGTAGTSTGGGGAGGSIGSGMVLWYKFDETSGTSAADSSGNARNGTLTVVGTGTATFSTTHQVGTRALSLTTPTSMTNMNGGYVSVPASLNAMGATTAITIACWVNVTTARNWARVWDFNNTSSTGYMFLTTQEQTNMRVRFAITQTNNVGEEMITSGSSLATGWHHIAVVLDVGATYTGTLYIDGAVAGTNTMMTLRPSIIGNTPNNWIGHSAFTADPYFSGLIDDFRVYNRALTQAEMTMLYAFR
jgi:hypothetical protein